MRKIAAVTVARSDYGILLPVLRAIEGAPDLRLRLVVSGAHLSPAFGRTVRAIEADRFDVAERVEMLISGDSPSAIATSIGVGVAGFAGAYARLQPDLLLLIGDRYEMLAAAAAAIPFVFPIAHIHGGEVTEGAFDEQIRHAITKISHLHFVATERAASRVRQMGEESWRVTIAGAPGLDNIGTVERLSKDALEARLGVRLDPAPLLVTYHPVTLEPSDMLRQTHELLSALADARRPIVITYPNADTANGEILAALREFAAARPDVALVDNLGAQGFFSLLAIAAAMVGNSSSGLVEAPSFALPVVNVGSRQAGRERAANVIDVAADGAAIRAGIDQALRPEFRAGLIGLANPYGDGHAAERIVRVLQEVRLDDRLIRKRFAAAEGSA